MAFLCIFKMKGGWVQLLCQWEKQEMPCFLVSLVAVESDYYQKSVSAPAKLSRTTQRWVGTLQIFFFGWNERVCAFSPVQCYSVMLMIVYVCCLFFSFFFLSCLRLVYAVERWSQDEIPLGQGPAAVRRVERSRDSRQRRHHQGGWSSLWQRHGCTLDVGAAQHGARHGYHARESLPLVREELPRRWKTFIWLSLFVSDSFFPLCLSTCVHVRMFLRGHFVSFVLALRLPRTDE